MARTFSVSKICNCGFLPSFSENLVFVNFNLFKSRLQSLCDVFPFEDYERRFFSFTNEQICAFVNFAPSSESTAYVNGCSNVTEYLRPGSLTRTFCIPVKSSGSSNPLTFNSLAVGIIIKCEYLAAFDGCSTQRLIINCVESVFMIFTMIVYGYLQFRFGRLDGEFGQSVLRKHFLQKFVEHKATLLASWRQTYNKLHPAASGGGGGGDAATTVVVDDNVLLKDVIRVAGDTRIDDIHYDLTRLHERVAARESYRLLHGGARNQLDRYLHWH